MAFLSPLVGLREAMEGSDDWRLSIQVLAQHDPRPLVLESCAITVPPRSSLYDVIQMLEHGGGLHSKAVGVHIVIQTESGPSESITAFPTMSGPLVSDSSTELSSGDHAPSASGSVLQLARTLSAHSLLPEEIAAIERLTHQIHVRLEQARAVSQPPADYAAGSWLMTRAYVAKALDGVLLAPPIHSDRSGHRIDPPIVDELTDCVTLLDTSLH